MIKVKFTNRNAKIPTMATDGSAGFDLSSIENADILPGETVLIRTGLAMSFPLGTFGAIYARSGLSIKEGLRPANCVGIIDSDYTGEILVALHNDSKEARNILKGQRIAQLVVQRCYNYPMELVDDLENTERGAKGFGSTGKN